MAIWKNECQRKHYEANKDVYIERAKRWKIVYGKRNRQFLKEYRNAHPCVDCGEDDWVVLEFDHVRGKKFMNVTDMSRRHFSIKKIQEEIDKCEVRCANCHRRKTHLLYK